MTNQELDLLAGRIKACREEEGLTLLQLAERAGVAPSTVQKVEKGHMVPTIAVLVKIANGLKRRVSYLIGDDAQDHDVSHRMVGQRASVSARNSVRAERLAGDIRDPEFDAYELVVPPGKGSGRDPLQHRGDELVICIKGTVSFQIGPQHFELRAGDSVHFKSVLPHWWRNRGKRTTKMIVIGSYPRTFQSAEIEETRMPLAARRRAG